MGQEMFPNERHHPSASQLPEGGISGLRKGHPVPREAEDYFRTVWGQGGLCPEGQGGLCPAQFFPQPSCQPPPSRPSSPLLPSKTLSEVLSTRTKQTGSVPALGKSDHRTLCDLLRHLGCWEHALGVLPLQRSYSPKVSEGPSLRTPRTRRLAFSQSGKGAPEGTRWSWWRATCSHGV